MTIYYWLDGTWCQRIKYNSQGLGPRFELNFPEEMSKEVVEEVLDIVLNRVAK